MLFRYARKGSPLSHLFIACFVPVENFKPIYKIKNKIQLVDSSV